MHSQQMSKILEHDVSRREWLRLGLGTLGATLPVWPGVHAALDVKPGRKPRSCIVLFFLGAPPQHETWDPKPDAPVEIRGDLKPIASATPGLMVGELMPLTAKMTRHIAVLRGVVTGDNAHSASGYYMTTGMPHQPMQVENARPGAPNDWPSLGALVRRLYPSNTTLPAAVTLPESSANDGNIPWPGQDGGFMGRSADPWLLHCEPEASPFKLNGLALPSDVPLSRFSRRQQLLDQVNARASISSSNAITGEHERKSRQAFDLIASPKARQAFNLDLEPARLRDRYGRDRFGQSVLLARRLVESGVPFVRVNWTRVKGALNNGHWDTHTQNTKALKQLMPIMDQTYSALLEDLHQRGMLDSTLVVWMAEFGRTPRINPAAGRDHWGQVLSVALAGGGVRGGIVHGASDRIAGYPRAGRVLPQDLCATILHCLGIAPDAEVHDTQNRPIPATRGKVISQIL